LHHLPEAFEAFGANVTGVPPTSPTRAVAALILSAPASAHQLAARYGLSVAAAVHARCESGAITAAIITAITAAIITAAELAVALFTTTTAAPLCEGMRGHHAAAHQRAALILRTIGRFMPRPFAGTLTAPIAPTAATLGPNAAMSERASPAAAALSFRAGAACVVALETFRPLTARADARPALGATSILIAGAGLHLTSLAFLPSLAPLPAARTTLVPRPTLVVAHPAIIITMATLTSILTSTPTLSRSATRTIIITVIIGLRASIHVAVTTPGSLISLITLIAALDPHALLARGCIVGRRRPSRGRWWRGGSRLAAKGTARRDGKNQH